MVKVVLENERTIELLLDTGAQSTSIPVGLAAELALSSGAALAEKRRLESVARITKELEGQGLVGVKVEVGARDGSTIGIHSKATAARALGRPRRQSPGPS